MAGIGGSHRRSGFTLVELLAVMAIISILAALLLPAIAKSRYQARVIQCKNNLRQIGIAIQMYSNAFDGWMPVDGNAYDGEVSQMEGPWASTDLIGTNIVWNGSMPYTVVKDGGQTQEFGHYRGLGLLTILNNQFIGDPAVLFCPDDVKTDSNRTMYLLRNINDKTKSTGAFDPANPDYYVGRCSYLYRQLAARCSDDWDKGKLGSLGNNMGEDLNPDLDPTMPSDDKPVKAIACDRNFIGMNDNTSLDYAGTYPANPPGKEVKINHGGTSVNVLYEDGHVDTVINTFPDSPQDLRIHMDGNARINLGVSDGSITDEMWRLWVLLDAKS